METVKEHDAIIQLSWMSEYELKPDQITMTEASAKRYLEEMLSYTRRSLERKRTFSNTSSESASSTSSTSKKATSTPLGGRASTSASLTREIDDKYEKK
jgi:hypothetical protein